MVWQGNKYKQIFLLLLRIIKDLNNLQVIKLIIAIEAMSLQKQDNHHKVKVIRVVWKLVIWNVMQFYHMVCIVL